MGIRAIILGLAILALSFVYPCSAASPGDPPRVILIKVTGDTTFARATNVAFTKENLDEAIATIVRPYLDSGYYYCQATVTDVASSDDGMSVELRLIRGPLVTLHDITCVGLSRTKPATVRKYINLPDSTPLTDRAVSKLSARARSIPFLTMNAPATVAPLPGYTAADLHLTFREPRQLVLQGTAGYRADDRNGLIWSLTAAMRNLFGDGRQVRLATDRTDKDHNTLGVLYRQPLFWFGVSDWSIDLSTRNFRKQFYEFNSAVRLETRIGNQTAVGVGAGWKRVDPATSDSSYQRYTAGLDYRSSSFEDTINPVGGARLDWSAAYVNRRYRSDSASTPRSSQNETRAWIKGEYCRKLPSRLVGIVAGNFATLETKEALPPISELYLIGGHGTLRGYRTDQFAARRAAYGSGELRWRGKNGYLSGFCDFAWLNRPEKKPDNSVVAVEQTQVGYGIGLNLIDRGRAVTLAFSWNPGVRFRRPQVLLKLVTGL
ncbi:MAG: BamA/TamA family outer membrane protein [candidate division Zixibacteria bacterium]|nr:BamA/TamA family outer membrane protein [candidate division Zixibacteria bacterium]